jgi:hypothetical protein
MSVSPTSICECSGCGKIKPVVAFATFRTKSGELRRRGICKKCRGVYAIENSERLREYRKQYNKKTASGRQIKERARRLEAKTFVNDYKETHPCVDCGKKFPAVAMDFDHVRDGKTRNVAGLVSGGYKLPWIKEEIAMCDLVCACCHRIRTSKRRENVAPRTRVRAAKFEVEPKFVRPKRYARGELVRGSRGPLAKLTERKVAEIRRRHAAGERPVNLARDFGVSTFTVYKILSRKTWTHVRGGVHAHKHRDAYKRSQKRKP